LYNLLGFFSYRKKKYGAFFLAYQTYTNHVFAVPISSTKFNSIFTALKLMLKVRKISLVENKKC